MCGQAVRTTTHLAAQRRLWKILAVGVTGEAISLVAEAAEVFYGKTQSCTLTLLFANNGARYLRCANNTQITACYLSFDQITLK